MDFAGSAIVHLTGGVSALAGTVVLGPRKGRFENPEEFECHNLPLVVLGTFALWFGWYGFNPGSTLGMHTGDTGAMAAQVAMSGFETTSSASGHTVATGPSSLDTGQAGRIAKSLMSDPAFGQLRDHLEGHSRSLIADFDWVRQVGLPLSQVIVWRGPTVDHSPYVGARVGEASHPGPSGGASLYAPTFDREVAERGAP